MSTYGGFPFPVSRCVYCRQTATLRASGNPAMGVPPHYLCDRCRGLIDKGKIQMSSYWTPPRQASAPSLPASSTYPSQHQLSSPPPPLVQSPQRLYPAPGPGVSFNPNLIGSPNERKSPQFLEVVEKQGPVIGYRAWTVSGDRLVGFMAGSQLGPWPAGAVQASCTAGHHREPPPSADCSCGFHAWANPKDVEARAGEAGVVVGAVQLWGKLIEHGDEGWRGEWAKPIALLKPGTTKAMVDFYKVAVAETEAGFEMLAGELAQ